MKELYHCKSCKGYLEWCGCYSAEIKCPICNGKMILANKVISDGG